MEINLQAVPAEGLTLQGVEVPAIIDIQDGSGEFKHPIKYKLEISVAGRMLLIRGELSTVVNFTCARCLKKFDSKITVTDFRRQKEIEDPEGIIDLTDAIREDMILALPTKPICRDTCRGICSHCGQDLNKGQCDCTKDAEKSPFSKLNNLNI